MSEERDRAVRTDIDLRLLGVWLVAWEPDTLLEEATAPDDGVRAAHYALVRAAYVQGYTDALHEERQGRRGELGTTHGYATP